MSLWALNSGGSVQNSGTRTNKTKNLTSTSPCKALLFMVKISLSSFSSSYCLLYLWIYFLNCSSKQSFSSIALIFSWTAFWKFAITSRYCSSTTLSRGFSIFGSSDFLRRPRNPVFLLRRAELPSSLSEVSRELRCEKDWVLRCYI